MGKSVSPYGRQAAEWRAVRRVFGCRRDHRFCVSLIMATGDAYRPFLHDLHFNAAFKDGLSAKPVDGDLTQPTLPERAQMRSLYRRRRLCRRVGP